MAGLLVAMGVMGVTLSMLMPAWSHLARREREIELVFRGEQYARAIELYQRRFVGAYPPDLDTLVEQRFLRRRYRDPMTEHGEFELVYRSQIDFGAAPDDDDDDREEDETDDEPDRRGRDETDQRSGRAVVAGSPDRRGGDPEPVRIRRDVRPQGGIVGVVSASRETSIRLYNGRRRYDEWVFVHAPTERQPGDAVADDEDRPRQPRRGMGGRPIGEDRSRFGLGDGRGAPPSSSGPGGGSPRR